MANYRSPWDFYPQLNEDRLSLIAEELLQVLDRTYEQLSTAHDDNYTRGTCTFGRQRQMLIALCLSGQHHWLQLTHPGMDVTFNIENIPVRFFADDPENPKKPGFFRRNEVDQLFEPQLTTPTLHRFIVEKPEFEGEGARVHFIGTNALDEIVSKWTYGDGRTPPVLHSTDDTPPSSVSIELDPIKAPQPEKKENSKDD
ncbi:MULTISPECIES: hypothetical protein [unclassified Pantoea]|uniref:hypothetical protein n=1 Tax=unclassified Pantoea TaxID=2630326 RepID=UPI00123221E0|nr:MULTISPECIES: hypothetical protein [unclassified Pantoea]KAA5952040.1 hypothetical protein F3I55_18290 [Pantoea sp. VH_24]KAA5953430.1 hypothetical protein F3I53_22360 [Pantoea sp. VH_16]KAA5961628.1 hypothetical protein F3I54_19130 [Pantoea sp. VH_18]KAA5993336.1 hypothetical protein F3I46_18765 [Pantoea sp. M_1]KAA5998100.1 hypothetical protein F3I45_19410 [Pantoea sp. F_7]